MANKQPSLGGRCPAGATCPPPVMGTAWRGPGEEVRDSDGLVPLWFVASSFSSGLLKLKHVSVCSHIFTHHVSAFIY